MSFSTEVKTEVTSHISTRTSAQLAALAAILICIGRIRPESDGTASLYIHTDNAAAATKFFTLLEKTTNIDFKFEILRPEIGKTAPGREIPLAVHSPEAWGLAQMLDLSEEPEASVVPWSLLSNDACVRAYLRSMFLCTGMISNPERTYRCEFVCTQAPMAQQLVTLLTERGIDVRTTLRRGNTVVYTNSADTIGDLLTLMEARNSYLQFQDARMQREVRGSVNRQVNCETANIRKTVTASRRQLEDIALLESCGRMAALPETLRETAKARKEHPDVSLQELGQLLDPPVGRSGMNHRLRNLHEAAEAVRRKASAESENKVG